MKEYELEKFRVVGEFIEGGNALMATDKALRLARENDLDFGGDIPECGSSCL